ncbi:hypothetical protein BD311DRAFT_449770 [Dichomitus squalens]|uniref:Uncharacterized protein n=1 Tax=Dichomitus squalens TaxID=114155 RepID=A0A4Q9MFZ2_9APHY|nr:hypothetical protein BD311DRAFT_449770 [Dichomitus squalens]
MKVGQLRECHVVLRGPRRRILRLGDSALSRPLRPALRSAPLVARLFALCATLKLTSSSDSQSETRSALHGAWPRHDPSAAPHVSSRTSLIPYLSRSPGNFGGDGSAPAIQSRVLLLFWRASRMTIISYIAGRRVLAPRTINVDHAPSLYLYRQQPATGKMSPKPI